MNKNYRIWFVFCLLLIPVLACSFPVPSLSSSTATPIPVVGGGGVTNGGGNPVPGSITSTASPIPSPSPSATPTSSPTPTPTFTPTPDRPGPYLVKQTETLGGESISGMICNTLQPFDVTYATPHVTFVTHYFPQDGSRGKWAYAYSIASAGESHEANGAYTLQPTKEAGVLLLSMSGSDHVVFHGFDGKVPSRYKFDLVPGSGATCP